MNPIEDTDFLRRGFKYGPLYASLRYVLQYQNTYYEIKANRDEGPQWKLRVYAADVSDSPEWVLLTIKVVESYDKLHETLHNLGYMPASTTAEDVTSMLS